MLSLIIWQGIYLPKDKTQETESLFLVEKGQNVSQIADNLEKEDFIKNAFYFKTYVLLKGKLRNLQAGEYLLSPSMSIGEIAQRIIKGEALNEKTITIIEGWGIRDIAWYFENEGMFQAEELMELAGFPLIDYSLNIDLPRPKDFSQEFDFLKDKPQDVGLEGYLFPDTYRIYRGDSIEEIVKKILRNFDKKITKGLIEEIKSQNKSIFEIVIVASLLEKEVRSFEDRKLVSGILWKRLNNNVPLQIDATITCITGKKTTKVSKTDTEIDSPYNTYKYLGLPLGPICNPGFESIMAAVYPEDSNFWYYLSTPASKTEFSQTLEEHNIKKFKYLK